MKRSFTKEELRLNQLKQKHLPSQVLFGTLTDDSQTQPVQGLVESETVHQTQKQDCHAIFDDFGDNQLFICINDNLITQLMNDSIPFLTL